MILGYLRITEKKMHKSKIYNEIEPHSGITLLMLQAEISHQTAIKYI